MRLARQGAPIEKVLKSSRVENHSVWILNLLLALFAKTMIVLCPQQYGTQLWLSSTRGLYAYMMNPKVLRIVEGIFRHDRPIEMNAPAVKLEPASKIA